MARIFGHVSGPLRVSSLFSMILHKYLEFGKILDIVVLRSKNQPIVVVARHRKNGGSKWLGNLQAEKWRPRRDALWAAPTHRHCKRVWRGVRSRSREPTKRRVSRWRQKRQLRCRMVMPLQRQKRWQDHWCPSPKNKGIRDLADAPISFSCMTPPGGHGRLATILPGRLTKISKVLDEYTVIIWPVAPDNSI